VRKSDGEVVADRRTRPFFLFHHVNAVDRDGAVDVDVVAYPDPSVLYELRLANLRSSTPPRGTGELWRMTVPISRGGEIEERRLSDVPLELPRIAPFVEGRAHRFVYAVGNQDRASFFDCLHRVDVRDGTVRTFTQPGLFPNEPVFIPAPGSVDEDEGVVLSLAIDARDHTSRLIVLDARTLALRADVVLPQLVPFHFHGQFFAAEGRQPRS
jgi:carotenoid cleavage dioxygenase-like enzyme